MPPSRIQARAPDGTRALRLTISVVLGITSIATVGFATPSLDTLVPSVVGVSVPGPAGCTSFIAPSSLIGFFGDYGVGLPVGGLAVCGVPGGVDEQTSPTGPLVDERSLVNSWPNGTFNGTSSVAADYGRLSSSAQANYAGDTSSLNVTDPRGSRSPPTDSRSPRPASLTGRAGTVVFRTTVNGSLSTTGTGSGWSPPRLPRERRGRGADAVRKRERRGVLLALASIGSVGLDGFARTPGHLDGSGEVVTAAIPIVFGTRFEYRFGLLGYAVPALTALVQSDFDAAITAIEVKGPGGVIVSDFTVTSDSGTSYGAGGVVAVGDDPHGGIGNPSRLSAFPNPSGTGPIALQPQAGHGDQPRHLRLCGAAREAHRECRRGRGRPVRRLGWARRWRRGVVQRRVFRAALMAGRIRNDAPHASSLTATARRAVMRAVPPACT